MRRIAVIGGLGYVGHALVEAFKKDPQNDVTVVTRMSYMDAQAAPYDILVNSAMPSGRFWARNNPEKDYEETVTKTKRILTHWKFTKLIQISTVSARCQLDTIYGKHKAEAESLCDTSQHLIVRLGPMFSDSLSKGVLIDMLNGRKVFIDGKSRYCFAPLDFVSGWIASHADLAGVVEVGAKDSISLEALADHLKKKIQFDGPLDDQEIQNPRKEFPPVSEVLRFLDQQQAKRVAHES